jgi:hypothetical protein
LGSIGTWRTSWRIGTSSGHRRRLSCSAFRRSSLNFLEFREFPSLIRTYSFRIFFGHTHSIEHSLGLKIFHVMSHKHFVPTIFSECNLNSKYFQFFGAHSTHPDSSSRFSRQHEFLGIDVFLRQWAGKIVCTICIVLLLYSCKYLLLDTVSPQTPSEARKATWWTPYSRKATPQTPSRNTSQREWNTDLGQLRASL